MTKQIPTSPLRYLQHRARINRLIDHYLTIPRLSAHLNNLPVQFTQPCPRPWERLSWNTISTDQIRGMDPTLFTQILASAAEVESPIRSYSQESWTYFQTFHASMATFLGGTYGEDQAIRHVGAWEKEERQHAPALSKIYQKLTGERLTVKPNTVSDYLPSDDPRQDVYDHLSSRITSEWSAISLYLWLMAHSTGALERAISQILQDEVNHLAKFWGFSRWAFGRTFVQQFRISIGHLLELARHHYRDRTYGAQVFNGPQLMMQLSGAVELAFTFSRVMVRIRRWNRELSPSYLRHLLGTHPESQLLQAV